LSATSTTVALTFDNGANSQYTLGYQQALQPHGVNATFYVNSGTVGNAAKMSWSQLSTLTAAGNEIGGKTVDGTSLTTLTTSQQISEICNDRQAILPARAQTIQLRLPGRRVQHHDRARCRIAATGTRGPANSLSPTGSVYAETLPRRIWLALRAYAPPGR
jgi:peptidoglycan/xylan/chitin deacetylase (PgdA/CDA1 family)